MKRVVAMADTHCGHVVGLTHPDFDTGHQRLTRLERARRTYWEWYAGEMAALQPIDALIFCGDAIEGKGEKSGGTELIENNRKEQVKMAAAAIQQTRAKKVVMCYGTPYHTGVDEDWEDEVADKVEAVKIGSHDWLRMNGQVFDYKHFISGSAVPHGRHTAMSREKLWNMIWAEAELYPKATILLRAHVHYFTVTGDNRYMGFTLPALQGIGTKHGARKCSGIVNVGFMHFDIQEDGSYQWHVHTIKPRPQQALVL